LLTEDELWAILQRMDITPRDKVLFILAFGDGTPKQVASIRKTIHDCRLHEGLGWNVSYYLTERSKGLAVRLKNGWALTAKGRDFIANSGLLSQDDSKKVIVSQLRNHLASITNPDTVGFLEEAIGCYEQNRYRAAVVLSWVGAASLLYSHVVEHHLAAFNAEALRRDAKWKEAKNADDLTRMKEHDFLEVLAALSIIGKNVKQELQNHCLQLRNACGHPNSFAVGANRVTSHIEVLMLNVFAVFA
jgi:hypothetical protein